MDIAEVKVEVLLVQNKIVVNQLFYLEEQIAYKVITEIETQFDIKFLKEFRKLILNFVKKGNKVILICGGGNTAREYQAAAKKVNPNNKLSSLKM